MKKIIEYECEICRYRSTDKKSVEKCEARGLGKQYPIGCIYGDHSEGAFYENITLAVAQNKIKKGCMGHSNTGNSWACRDNGYGDSLGRERCGSGTLYLNKHDGRLDFNHPTFKRMVDYLKSKNIPITVWDGSKPVPYKKWMKKQVK